MRQATDARSPKYAECYGQYEVYRQFNKPLRVLALLVSLMTFFAAVWFLAGYASQYRTRQEIARAERMRRANQKCFPLAVDSSFCIERGASAGLEQQRAESDLQAQQDMAEWARWMAYISAMQAFVGIVGTYYVVRSFRKTNEAVAASSRANDIAESNALSQQRAWITYVNWDCHGIGEPGRVEGYGFRLNFKNSGPTPALNARILVGLVESEPFRANPPTFPAASKGTVLGPEVGFGGGFQLTPEEVFASHKNPVRIRCYLTYKTVFKSLGERHTDVTWSFQFIGRHSLDEIRRGEITGVNFAVFPGAGDDTMT